MEPLDAEVYERLCAQTVEAPLPPGDRIDPAPPHISHAPSPLGGMGSEAEKQHEGDDNNPCNVNSDGDGDEQRCSLMDIKDVSLEDVLLLLSTEEGAATCSAESGGIICFPISSFEYCMLEVLRVVLEIKSSRCLKEYLAEVYYGRGNNDTDINSSLANVDELLVAAIMSKRKSTRN